MFFISPVAAPTLRAATIYGHLAWAGDGPGHTAPRARGSEAGDVLSAQRVAEPGSAPGPLRAAGPELRGQNTPSAQQHCVVPPFSLCSGHMFDFEIHLRNLSRKRQWPMTPFRDVYPASEFCDDAT